MQDTFDMRANSFYHSASKPSDFFTFCFCLGYFITYGSGSYQQTSLPCTYLGQTRRPSIQITVAEQINAGRSFTGKEHRRSRFIAHHGHKPALPLSCFEPHICKNFLQLFSVLFLSHLLFPNAPQHRIRMPSPRQQPRTLLIFRVADLTKS